MCTRYDRVLFLIVLILAMIFISMAGCRLEPGPAKEVRFEKTVLSEDYLSEGVAVGDINRDGRRDVIAGTTWFEAPDWERHDIAEVKTFYPDSGYSDAFGNYVLDVDLDGWTDIIQFEYPGTEVLWYRNPGETDSDWIPHVAFDTYGNESPLQVDVNSDGRFDLVVGDHRTNRLVWLEAPQQEGETNWTVHEITSDSVGGSDRYAHGLGYGDINLDGRLDVITAFGWWSAPEDLSNPWIERDIDFGPDAAQMYAVDVDADGDNDIVSSSAHMYGIWNHVRDGNPSSRHSWSRTTVDSSLSQTHALAVQDIDRDGDDDMITGKRYLAHNGNDPGAGDPALLVWYELDISKDGTAWIRHTIDEESGVGTQVVATDIDGDDRSDIAVSNKKGVFVFLQK